MMLPGFTVFNLNEGLPYASITNNGVTFNKSTVLKMNCARYVLLLLDEKDKRMAIQVCEKEEDGAAPFYKDSRKTISVRWNSKDLLCTLQDIMKWNLDTESYKVDGVLMREENAMVFDLTQAIRTS